MRLFLDHCYRKKTTTKNIKDASFFMSEISYEIAINEVGQFFKSKLCIIIAKYTDLPIPTIRNLLDHLPLKMVLSEENKSSFWKDIKNIDVQFDCKQISGFMTDEEIDAALLEFNFNELELRYDEDTVPAIFVKNTDLFVLIEDEKLFWRLVEKLSK